jgi:hypothetical protein
MGNSVLTGDQHHFTCAEIEVFKVKVLRDQPILPPSSAASSNRVMISMEAKSESNKNTKND